MINPTSTPFQELRITRQSLGISIGQLSALTDGLISKQDIRHIEDGRENPPAWKIRLLRRVLIDQKVTIVA